MKDIIQELWAVALRTFWLALTLAFIVLAVRLMAWADTGSRGDGSTIERSVLP